MNGSGSDAELLISNATVFRIFHFHHTTQNDESQYE
jgi:hypothetical protein